MTRDSDEESYTHPSHPYAMDTACIGGSRRRRRSVSLRHEECSNESEPTSPQKPYIENLVEMVRKRIDEDKLQSHGGIGSSVLRISDSLLSSEIMSHRFSKKLVILSFDCYTGVTDPV